jgi:hypothetical protein
MQLEWGISEMFQLLVEIYMIGLCCQNFHIIKKYVYNVNKIFFQKNHL